MWENYGKYESECKMHTKLGQKTKLISWSMLRKTRTHDIINKRVGVPTTALLNTNAGLWNVIHFTMRWFSLQASLHTLSIWLVCNAKRTKTIMYYNRYMVNLYIHWELIYGYSVDCIVIGICCSLRRRCLSNYINDVIIFVWAQFAILIVKIVGVTPEQLEHAIRVHA